MKVLRNILQTHALFSRSLIFFLFFFFVEKNYAETLCYVKTIIDGDTIILQDGRHIRYIGINTPEIDHKNQKAEPYAYAARDFNSHLVSNTLLLIEFDDEQLDQYNRFLAYVFLPDGTFVNQEILKKGYAYILLGKFNRKYEKELLRVQQSAMNAQVGIWGNWQEKAGLYVGNLSSKRYHLETCAFGRRIGKNNLIVFKTQWNAFWNGYAPCKKCIPSINLNRHQ